jgi:ATP phosphoribosyltransferase
MQHAGNTVANTKQEAIELARYIRDGVNGSDEDAGRFIEGLLTKPEIPVVNNRAVARQVLSRMLKEDGCASIPRAAEEVGCSEETTRIVWRAIRDQYPAVMPPADKFSIAIPKERRALSLVEDILLESGFRMDMSTKTLVDIKNGMSPMAFRIGRGRDIPVLMKAGVVHCGFLGNDKIIEVQDEARENGNEPVALDIRRKFSINAFRMCFAVPQEQGEKPILKLADLEGKLIATTYISTLKQFLAAQKITTARVIHLSGDVEEACRDLGADAILDIVETGGSLRKNNLRVLGEPIYQGNMSFMALEGVPRSTMLDKFTERLKVQDLVLKVA